MAGYTKGTTAHGEAEKMRGAFVRATTAIQAAPNPEQAFREADEFSKFLGDLASEFAGFRAHLAAGWLDANGLTKTQLAELLGVTKVRAGQIVKAAREKGNTVTDPGTEPLPPWVALAVITSDRGVLIERRKDGKPPWTFPGGEYHPGESPADAVIRRIPEETGITITAEKLLGYRIHPRTGRPIAYMVAHPDSTDTELLDTEDLAEVQWVTIEQTRELMPDMFEPVRAYLDNLAASDA